MRGRGSDVSLFVLTYVIALVKLCGTWNFLQNQKIFIRSPRYVSRKLVRSDPFSRIFPKMYRKTRENGYRKTFFFMVFLSYFCVKGLEHFAFYEGLYLGVNFTGGFFLGGFFLWGDCPGVIFRIAYLYCAVLARVLPTLHTPDSHP